MEAQYGQADQCKFYYAKTYFNIERKWGYVFEHAIGEMNAYIRAIEIVDKGVD